MAYLRGTRRIIPTARRWASSIFQAWNFIFSAMMPLWCLDIGILSARRAISGEFFPWCGNVFRRAGALFTTIPAPWTRLTDGIHSIGRARQNGRSVHLIEARFLSFRNKIRWAARMGVARMRLSKINRLTRHYAEAAG